MGLFRKILLQIKKDYGKRINNTEVLLKNFEDTLYQMDESPKICEVVWENQKVCCKIASRTTVCGYVSATLQESIDIRKRLEEKYPTITFYYVAVVG